jgi:hypothetical protein
MTTDVFTTRGWVPADQVEMRESVTFEDATIRMVRVDKYIGGEWVGNDLRGDIKTGVDIGAIQAQL